MGFRISDPFATENWKNKSRSLVRLREIKAEVSWEFWFQPSKGWISTESKRQIIVMVSWATCLLQEKDRQEFPSVKERVSDPFATEKSQQ